MIEFTKVNRNKLFDFSFFTLNICIILSLNSLLFNIFGVSQGASPIIFLCVFFILYIGKINVLFFSQLPIAFYFLVYFFYFTLGTITRIFIFPNIQYKIDFLGLYFSLFSNIIYILGLFTYLNISLIKDKNISKVFNFLYIPFLASTSVIVIQQFFGLNNFVLQDMAIDESRAMGVFANPNAAGLIANITVLFTLLKMKNNKLFIFVLFFCLYATFLTLSKSAIIISILLIFYYLIYWIIRSEKKLALVFYLVIFALVGNYLISNFEEISSLYLGDSETRRLSGVIELAVNGEFNSETTSSRSDLFEYGWQKIKESPILGNGIGYFQYFPDQKHGVHNSFLMIWGESGIFALLFLIFLFGYIFIDSQRREKSIGFFIAGLILILLGFSSGSHNFFDDKISILIQVLIITFYLYQRTIKYEIDKL